jgi:hypothetical protein
MKGRVSGSTTLEREKELGNEGTHEDIKVSAANG